MLRFKDFIPQLIKKGGFFSNDSYEKTEQCLQRMNYWIEDHQINLLKVETLLLPDYYGEGYSRYSKSTDQVFYQSVGGSSSYKSSWHQVFRVWYYSN